MRSLAHRSSLCSTTSLHPCLLILWFRGWSLLLYLTLGVVSLQTTRGRRPAERESLETVVLHPNVEAELEEEEAAAGLEKEAQSQ